MLKNIAHLKATTHFDLQRSNRKEMLKSLPDMAPWNPNDLTIEMKCIFQMVFIDISQCWMCVYIKPDTFRIDIGKLILLEMISIKAYLRSGSENDFVVSVNWWIWCEFRESDIYERKLEQQMCWRASSSHSYTQSRGQSRSSIVFNVIYGSCTNPNFTVNRSNVNRFTHTHIYYANEFDRELCSGLSEDFDFMRARLCIFPNQPFYPLAIALSQFLSALHWFFRSMCRCTKPIDWRYSCFFSFFLLSCSVERTRSHYRAMLVVIVDNRISFPCNWFSCSLFSRFWIRLINWRISVSFTLSLLLD